MVLPETSGAYIASTKLMIHSPTGVPKKHRAWARRDTAVSPTRGHHASDLIRGSWELWWTNGRQVRESMGCWSSPQVDLENHVEAYWDHGCWRERVKVGQSHVKHVTLVTLGELRLQSWSLRGVVVASCGS